MLKSQEGQKIPDITFPVRVNGEWRKVNSDTLFKGKGYRFEEIELGSHGISFSSLLAVSGRGNTPQVYIDGQHVGGADDLENWLAR